MTEFLRVTTHRSLVKSPSAAVQRVQEAAKMQKLRKSRYSFFAFPW